MTGGRGKRPRRRSRWLGVAAAASMLAVIVGFPARAPATIAEQRQRLPPPAQCGDDPVEGMWKSHKYDARFGEWVIFMLEIHHAEGSDTELTGKITNHSWVGTPQDEEPPGCGPGSSEWVVETDARGRIDERGHIRFWGVGQWRVVRRICPSLRWGGYNLDAFDGVIDRELNEFQTHNNDGGRDVNEPYVFRRIRCFPEEAEIAPQVEPVPPPFYPERGGGCSCW